MEWALYVFYVQLQAKIFCQETIEFKDEKSIVLMKECEALFYDCVMDGESLDFCKYNYKFKD